MGKIKGIPEWMVDDEISGKFLMLPPDIFEEPAFQNLSHAARLFYILLNAHKQTELQRYCLYQTMKEYNEQGVLPTDKKLTEEDLKDECMPTKKTKYTSGYFVATQKQLERYGYSPQYANKLKNELIQAGFIKVFCGGKSKRGAWNRSVTIYKFSNSWKTKHTKL